MKPARDFGAKMRCVFMTSTQHRWNFLQAGCNAKVGFSPKTCMLEKIWVEDIVLCACALSRGGGGGNLFFRKKNWTIGI